AILFLPLTIFFPTRLINRKNLPRAKKQNVILACNHMSNFDLPIVAIKFRRKFTYLGKGELFKNKVLGWFLKKFDVIPVDRNKADLGAIKKVFSAIARKRHVCVCPQGTRSKPGEIDENTVKDGISLFALRTGTPVLPMVILKKPKIFRFNKIIVGELIYPDMERARDKEYSEEFTKLVVSKMNELLASGGKNANKDE
ncbi:MAG: 1-acyl-sn-glycerol-3-phosphate acyltransferase, partial [Clostridia bacterium]|nr:1-acyl-sn-glycerol-3-phosphate acyltransferase [Clostridia bacterium]